MVSLFSNLFSRQPKTHTRRQSPRPTSSFRPTVEGLEDRVVPSTLTKPKGPPPHAMARIAENTPVLTTPAAQNSPVFQAAQKSEAAAQVSAQQLNLGGLLNLGGSANLLDIADIEFTANAEGDIFVVDEEGVVRLAEGAVATVTGTLAGLPFTAELTDFALELIPDGNGEDGACSVLDLELGPIDLDLLGLHVNTSPICLSITAFEGEGILGDLLCGLAGGDLDILDGGGLTNLTNGLTNILDGALGRALRQAGPADANDPLVEDICEGECEILNLAVGPLDLDLLGVNVHLDDCEGGPLQVCVSASQGEGILGDLLCALADGIPINLPNLTPGQIRGIVNDLIDDLGLTDEVTNKEFNRLVRLATRLLGDGELSVRDIRLLARVFINVTR